MLRLRTCALLLAAAASAAGQGSLTLTATTHPSSFDAGSSAPCVPAALTCFDELVKTEPLTVVLTTVPTPQNPPPAILQPRRLAIWLGPEFAPGVPFGAYFPGLTSPNLVFLAPAQATPGGVIAAAPLVDSFSSPFAPVFGPPLSGPSNTIQLTFGFDLPSPAYFLAATGAPLTLVLQAVCEDVPGSPTPLLLSNALELNFVDPEANHAPALTALDAPDATSVSPSAARAATGFSAPLGQLRSLGPETGGDVLVLDGVNFLAQSNGALVPPTVRFTSRDDATFSVSTTAVVVLSPTRLAVTTPALPATAPPFTRAGYYTVELRNHQGLVSPSAQFHAAAEGYLYVANVAPQITSLTVTPGAGVATSCGLPNAASPEGGDVLVLGGSGFLERSTIRFTHFTGGSPTPGLAPWRVCPPPAAFGGGGSSITVATPPFRSGTVVVEVIGPDESVAVAPTTLLYCDLKPALASLAPTFASTPLGAAPLPSFVDTGSSTTSLVATDVVSPISPLFAATIAATLPPPTPPATATPPACTGSIGPTVVPGTVATTRYEVTGAGFAVPQLLTPTYSGATLTTLALPSINDDDDLRPQLGVRTLRAVNPPSVQAAGGELFGDPVAILVQDQAPPAPTSVTPDVAPASIPPGFCAAQPAGLPYRLTVSGPSANFFSVDAAREQTFDPVATPSLASLMVPAVRFAPTGGGPSFWSPHVKVLSVQAIEVDTPPFMTTGAYVLTVVNPDGRFASLAASFRIVPPLTDPCALTDPGAPFATRLDEPFLQAAAQPLTSRFVFAGLPENLFAIAPVVNPTAFLDFQEEQQNGSIPPAAAAAGPGAYDFCFLFNTRRRGTGDLRPFDFNAIDLPETITFTAPIVAIGFDGALVSLPAGTRRVIIKAAAFDFDPATSRFRWFLEQNYPLVLRSKGTFRTGALFDLSGDSLMREIGLLAGSAIAFQTRHDWSPAPAGGGFGGRGGSYYCSQPMGTGTPGTLAPFSSSSPTYLASSSPGCLAPAGPPSQAGYTEQWGLDLYAPTGGALGIAAPPIVATLPPGNAALGVGSAVMEASPGYPPQPRADAGGAFPPPPFGGAPFTGGRGGLGRAPVGGQGGGGGGGGGAPFNFPNNTGAGANGGPGATGISAAGGLAAGNATSFPSGLPIPGQPPLDPYVYGGTLAPDAGDFVGLLGAGYADVAPPPGAVRFPVPLLCGGSGGGGGGGSVAIFVPCVSVGGRGGNGGGSVVFLTDVDLVFTAYGRVLVDGEEGRRGLDAFPIPNQDPLFVLCAPGNGGGGAGGVFYALAIANVVVPTPVFTPTVSGAPTIVAARGGKGAVGGAGSPTPTAPGGDGGAGRVRFAVNAFSSRAASVEASLDALFSAGALAATPSFAPLSFPNFFRYPSP